MTALSDLVPSLKRAVAPLGEFESVYTEASDDDLAGALADGFAEAQLDRFFISPAYTIDTDLNVVAPDLTSGQGALVIIYAACTLITAKLLNTQNRRKFQAGRADVELETAASILTTLLKQFNDRKTQLRTTALYSSPSAFAMADGYFLAATGRYVFSGDYYGSGYNDPNAF